MSKPHYTFRPQARQDAINTALFIAKDSPRAADNFLKALEQTCKTIAQMPGLGSHRSYKHPLLKHVRMLPVKGFENYLVFYQSQNNGVDVIRIIHGSRDLPALFQKSSN